MVRVAPLEPPSLPRVCLCVCVCVNVVVYSDKKTCLNGVACLLIRFNLLIVLIRLILLLLVILLLNRILILFLVILLPSSCSC